MARQVKKQKKEQGQEMSFIGYINKCPSVEGTVGERDAAIKQCSIYFIIINIMILYNVELCIICTNLQSANIFPLDATLLVEQGWVYAEMPAHLVGFKC